MIDLNFILERYNYWIVIVLMMVGLFIVIARGNLVKKIVGLNIFQTSVFIYYISIGKIAGGTAPILLGGHGGDHGGGHAGAAESEGAAHGAAALKGETLHAAPAGAEIEDLAPNVIGEPGDAAAGGADGALHAAPSANPPITPPDGADPTPAFEIAPPAEAGAPEGEAAATDAARHAVEHGVELIRQSAEVVYSNPLPHVLILTAIVVGVATTAVGLALAVRIREAYGSVEEDELEAADEIAEFGYPISRPGEARA